MPEMPNAPTLTLEVAPGAKAAKTCGILSILFGLTCLGLPVAIVLGIVALVQQSKAKRFAQANPDRFAPVSATGLVTGIIGLVMPVLMLPFIGIVSAVSIPALLAQRERAREKVVQAMVAKVADEVVHVSLDAPRTKDGHLDPQGVVKTVLAKPEFLLPKARNPFTTTECAYVEADAPAHDGQIAVKGGFTKDVDGKMHPAVQIRGQIRRAGHPDLVSKVVTLD